jgi:hypothetical protein
LKNRISRVIQELDELKAIKPKTVRDKCVIVINKDVPMITMSCKGEIHTWHWTDKGICIDNSAAVHAVHPLAAEAYVVTEISHYIVYFDINSEDIIFVDDVGRTVNEIVFHPPELGIETPEMKEQKSTITNLFFVYSQNDLEVTSEMLDLAKKHSVLGPFLSLINNV